MTSSIMDSIARHQSSPPLKILMFPWLGYGHITPFLALANNLTSRGNIKVYLCSTLATLASVEQKIDNDMSRSIKLIPLLLPVLPELPRKLHTTNGLPPALMPNLKKALHSPLSIEAFDSLLVDLTPDLIIYDFIQPWVPSVARARNIPAVVFITSSCTSISVMCHYLNNPRGDLDYPFREIRFRDYESSVVESIVSFANDKNERDFVYGAIEQSSGGVVLIKGFREAEAKHIDYCSELIGKKIVPVGPLVQEPSFDRDGSELLAWLDKKEQKSAVFVSFGSEYFLSKADMKEIAVGLETSGVNFIWVVRFPKRQSRKALPEGFVERVGGRGRVVEGWAPQAKILVHENVGGFVSHCGWNSVLESMSIGVPIIALPMHLDQPINARLVESVGVGIEVLRDRKGKLHGEKLAEVIRKVVVEDSGDHVRKTAAGMREKLKAKGDQETEEVIQELMSLVKKD